MGIPIVDLVQVKTGRNGGTWGHPQVAIHCGQWCSPAFAVKVTEWVFTWMTTGQNPLQSDLDRLIYRDSLKDDARLRMTDQVSLYDVPLLCLGWVEVVQILDNFRFL